MTAYDVMLELLPAAKKRFLDHDDNLLQVIEDAFQSFDGEFGLSVTFTPYRHSREWGFDLYHHGELISHAAPWRGEIGWIIPHPFTTHREWVHHKSSADDFAGEFGAEMANVIARLQQRRPAWS